MKLIDTHAHLDFGEYRLVCAVASECLVLETDLPSLVSEPYRGRRKEPEHVKIVAEKIAELKNITIEEIAGKTTGNAQKVP